MNSLTSRLLLFLFFLSLNPAYSANKDYFTDKAIRDHQHNAKIIAAAPAFFPPFYYQNSDGTAYGMAIEVLNEIDHSAGYVTTYNVKKNWAEVFKAIEAGEAQVIPNLSITEERKKYYFFSKPYAHTNVNVFSRNGFGIKSEQQLSQFRIAVVEKNIGEEIAKKRNYHYVAYPGIDQAFEALINKQVDILIFPKLIANTAANRLNIKHQLHDTGITLKTIDRALAVSKRHPEIFNRLNTSLEQYLSSQDFSDTYIAWFGSNGDMLSDKHLIVINILVLLCSIFIFYFLWKKKKFSVFGPENSTTWIISLIAIFVVATTTVTLVTSWLLYETSFEGQRHRLIDSVKSRARLIESAVRYDIKEGKLQRRSLSESHNKTIEKVVDAHKHFRGFGRTGEFTFARKNNDQVEFVLRQRHSLVEKPIPIPLNSINAIPMQLALHGHSGTIVAKDYRGEQVLAAYEYISTLDMGIVAKIDLNEIREPFIHSALYILTMVILFSFFGSLLYFYIMLPVLKKIQESEQRFRQLFLNNNTPSLLVSASNAQIIDANHAAITFYGYSREELQSCMFSALCTDPNSPTIEQLQHVSNKKNLSIDTQHRLHGGVIRDVEILMSPVEMDNETVIYCTIVDVTEKMQQQKEHEKMQQDLVQARKMEALGQLTGGIAHDFNNMLTIIMGYTELSQEKIANDKNHKVPGYLEHIMTASNHAKRLISSMMVFSRTDQGNNIALNIAPLIKEDIKLLRPIIPSSIKIIPDIDSTVPSIMIEPVKLQQLIMNLCVNARDAMDAQGTLTVKLTYREDLSDNCLICYEHFTGNWVELTVSDTGSGMTEEIKQRMFEPFFTTKDIHKGTGMGMAVVHGIVQDLGGHITIDTKPGKGSAIHILFKPLLSTDEQKKEDVIQYKEEQHHERIMIVDDEMAICEMVADILELYGYQCSCFSSSQQALDEYQQAPGNFDLIFSDQTMPDLTGLEMIEEMRKIRPDIPAIIATGYSDSINDVMAKEQNIKLLRKPLPKDLILQTVSEIFQ